MFSGYGNVGSALVVFKSKYVYVYGYKPGQTWNEVHCQPMVYFLNNNSERLNPSRNLIFPPKINWIIVKLAWYLHEDFVFHRPSIDFRTIVSTFSTLREEFNWNYDRCKKDAKRDDRPWGKNNNSRHPETTPWCIVAEQKNADKMPGDILNTALPRCALQIPAVAIYTYSNHCTANAIDVLQLFVFLQRLFTQVYISSSCTYVYTNFCPTFLITLLATFSPNHYYFK